MALRHPRLPEQLSIAVSSWYQRRLFVDHPSFTIALHEPHLRRSQLNVGNRRASKVVTERYEGLWRSKADGLSMLGGVGDRAPIVNYRVSSTPKTILIIRDLFREQMRFRSQSFERGKL